MRQGHLRRVVMWLVLLGHFVAMGSSFLLISDFDEALGVALALLPLTSVILMIIVRFQDRHFFGARTDTKNVAADAATLTILLSGLLIGSIILMIWAYYKGYVGSVGSLQKGINLIDTGIVVYLAILLKRLFESAKQE